MREILFRGKRIDNDEWAEGFYVHIPCGRFLCDEHMIQTVEDDGKIGQLHDVYEYTVGQFTGLTDCRNKRLFEHDVVTAKFKNNGARYNFEIIFRDGYFVFDNGSVAVLFERIRSARKIGNIHDNPELLEDSHGK